MDPIFVVGTGRSGTTLLRFMLCAHPRIYIAHEASYYVWEKIGPRRGFLDYYFKTPSFRWLRVDPERVRQGLGEQPSSAEAFGAVMREKAAQYGRVRFGDKTPSHAAFLRRVFQDYPGARVVHIVRDPRGVCLSLTRMPWAPGCFLANARFCEAERRQVAPFRDRVLQIRLEDLVVDARTTMGKVLEHVGEPWDDAVLDHPRHIPDKNDMPPLPWLESAAGERSRQAPPWESMRPEDVRLVERITRRVMEHHGYDPAPLPREPSRFAVWWNGVRQIPELMHSWGVFFRLFMLSRNPNNFNGKKTHAAWHRLNPKSWSRYPGFEIPTPP